MPHFRAHLDPDLLASRVLSPCLFHSLTNKSGISIQLGVTSFAKPCKPCTPLAGTSTLLLDLAEGAQTAVLFPTNALEEKRRAG